MIFALVSLGCGRYGYDEGQGDGGLPAACSDEKRNIDETDVDCGGSCLPCENGKSCELVADCQSGVCSAANTCRACVTQADCSSGFYCDGLGGCATTHSNGTMCAVGFECTSGSCIDCGSGFTCHDADDCLANGVVCDGGLQCASGNCIDGFCCNTSCGNACDACDLAGAEGNCSLVNAGLQGNPSCSPYLCSGMSELCPFRCVESFDCAQGSICVNNACAPNGS